VAAGEVVAFERDEATDCFDAKRSAMDIISKKRICGGCIKIIG
jgi:hypothetical protein